MAPKRKRLADNARGDPAPKLPKANDRLQEVAQALMRLDVPVQRLAKSMCRSRNDHRKKEHEFDTDLTAFSKMVTPYGTVATTIELPAVNGDTIALHCNNPFALLWAASSVNNEFGNFIHGHLTANNGKGRVVVYIDETTPGNALRPDNGRKFEALLFFRSPNFHIGTCIENVAPLSSLSSKSLTCSKLLVGCQRSSRP